MRRSERGANLVEFAIVAPLLILLIAGIADIGRAFHSYMIITNASREAARYAARYPLHNIGICQAALNETTGSAVTLNCATDLAKTFPNASSAGGQPVRVTVTINFPTIIGSFIGTNNLTLSARTEMAIFGLDTPP